MLFVTILFALVGFAVSTIDHELDEKFRKMPREQFIEYFNAQNYTWKMKYQPHLEHTVSCATFTNANSSGLEIKRYDPAIYATLPTNFDARQKWSECQTMNDIFNQGKCGSCWTFGTATVAADRLCIAKQENIRLSEQDLDCLGPICNGGDPEEAFAYWKYTGLVSSNCKPYNISSNQYCVRKCKDTSIDYAKDKHHAERFYKVSSVNEDIKAELFTNGPICATFDVYRDFQHYHGGIYEYKAGEWLGGHAVRLIGYGEENGVEYWLAANSWGTKWGERGFFKIKKYQSEMKFEDYLLTGIAKN